MESQLIHIKLESCVRCGPGTGLGPEWAAGPACDGLTILFSACRFSNQAAWDCVLVWVCRVRLLYEVPEVRAPGQRQCLWCSKWQPATWQGLRKEAS